MKNILLKILIITLSISALLGIVIIIFDVDSDIAEKTLLTSLVVFGFSVPGLCCSTVFGKKYRTPLSITGMIICLAGCMYFLLTIWEAINIEFENDLSWQLMFVLPILALSSAHISLVSLPNPKNSLIKLMQIATIVMSVIIDVIILLAILFNEEAPAEVFATLAILTALGTLTTPIANKITKTPVVTPEDNHIATEPVIDVGNFNYAQQSAENTDSIFVLAQKLYSMSIDLKSTTEESLNSKADHTQLLKTINNLQFTVCRMNIEMLQTATHSMEYLELITYMDTILCSCTSLLLNQQGNYKATVCSYLRGFHNLPKAFLPLDDLMRVSPQDAMAYFKSYC